MGRSSLGLVTLALIVTSCTVPLGEGRRVNLYGVGGGVFIYNQFTDLGLVKLEREVTVNLNKFPPQIRNCFVLANPAGLTKVCS